MILYRFLKVPNAILNVGQASGGRDSTRQVEFVETLFFLIPSIWGKNLRVNKIKGINIKMDNSAVIGEILTDSLKPNIFISSTENELLNI